ncbi:MAG: phosphatase PAP2 family protein [Cytophagaceae bacterium]|nr:phosphatase PAP2 family protein [Cytophagaceae bacterium]MDW8456800.1 phosphatase PAP2 family protein [Cytophagaceae bacterium]
MELIVNQNHNLFFDYFFYYITALGNGMAALAYITILLLFVSTYSAIHNTVSILVTTVFIQTFKLWLFSHMVRPASFFAQQNYSIYIVEGVELHSNYSFPSGHTAQAACLTLCTALCMRNKKIGAVLFLIALMVSFSRVYLMQHFLIDTYAGMWLGTIVAIASYNITEKYFGLKNNLSLHRGLLMPVK